MKTFGQFLAEGRDAPLYHGTYNSIAQTIIKSDVLQEGISADEHWTSKNKMHVSLTRDYHFAKTWGSPDPVIFELNQAKLIQRYKIVPFNYFPDVARRKGDPFAGGRHWQNQSEEAVVGDIKPLSRFLTKVIIPTAEYIQRYSPLIREHPLLYVWKEGYFINEYKEAAE